jgi:hypothetical protein
MDESVCEFMIYKFETIMNSINMFHNLLICNDLTNGYIIRLLLFVLNSVTMINVLDILQDLVCSK